MKQIKIKIAPDGTPTVEALGFGNVGCKAATKPIESALGEVTAQVTKPESSIPEINPNQQTNDFNW